MTKARDLANAGTALTSVSATELGYLDGVTSAVQTQIDAKLATTTAASTYAPSASPTFTGTVTLPSTTSVGNVSATELGYVDGVTSAIQTQLDAKLSSATAVSTYSPINLTLNEQTGTTYTLVLSDSFKLITASNASAQTYSIPTNSSVAFPIGTQISLVQAGVGQVTIDGPGVTINSTPGLKLRARWSAATLIKIATDSWIVIGDLAA